MNEDDDLDDLGPVPAPGEADATPPEDPAGPVALAAREPMNDTGNGARLRIHFGEDLIWVRRVGWHVWDGMHWAPDPDEVLVRQRAQALGPLIAREAALMERTPREAALLRERAGQKAELGRLSALAPGEVPPDHAERVSAAEARLAATEQGLRSFARRSGRILTFAKDAGNSGRMKNMLSEAAVHLAREVGDLDAAPLDLNTLSGLLRFDLVPGGDGASAVASVALLPHLRGQMAAKVAPVAYDPGARCPLFEAFLARVQPAAEMRRFLQRWLGLSMTAITAEQKLCFWYGAGANGKSVLAELVARLLGAYATSARIESLTGRNRRGGGDATPDLVPMIGARMIRTSEPEEGERLQESTIKQLTSGEPLLVRALNSDFVEVRPVGKITISGNHKPEVRGTDDGIWRRLLLVPWDVQIPPAERDPMLVERLWAERSGILNWLVEGLLEYLEGGLQEPAAVLEATAEFRSESDPVGAYLGAACAVTGLEGDFLHSRDLIEAFNFWRFECGENQWRPGTVSRAIKEKSRRWVSPASGQRFGEHKRAGLAGYTGIRFQDAFRRRFEEAPRDSQGRLLMPRGTREDGA